MAVTTKMVKDGARTIIAIEGATEEQDTLAYLLLNLYHNLLPKDDYEKISAMAASVSTVPVIDKAEGMENPPQLTEAEDDKLRTAVDTTPSYTPDDFIIPVDPYQGVSARTALKMDFEKAFIFLYKNYREETSSILKAWANILPKNVKAMSIERKRTFLFNMDELLNLKNKAKTSNWELFLSKKSDENIEALANSIANHVSHLIHG